MSDTRCKRVIKYHQMGMFHFNNFCFMVKHLKELQRRREVHQHQKFCNVVNMMMILFKIIIHYEKATVGSVLTLVEFSRF